MSIKKSLKKSVVLGALMSFVITGNAYAAVNTGIGWLDTMINSNPELSAAVEKVIESGVADRIEDAVAKALKDYEGGLTAEQKNELVNGFNTTIGKLETQIKDLTSQLGVSKEQLAAANKLYNDTKAELDKLASNYAANQKLLEAAQKAAENAAKDLAQLQQDIADGKFVDAETLEKAEQAAQDAANKVAGLTNDLNLSKEKLEAAQKAAQDAADKIAQITKDYELSQGALNQQITDLKNQLAQYEELKNVLGNGDLTTALANLKEVKDDLHKVASLAGTIDETIKEAKAKAAEYEALARENAALVKEKLAAYEDAIAGKLDQVEGKLNQYEDAIAGKIDKVEDKLNQYEDAIAGKIDKVEDKLNQYEDAIAENVGKLEDKIQENVTKVEGAIKDQAAALKDVQENVIKDISYDKATDTTKVDNNVNITKDLTVGGNATVAGTLTAKDVVSDTANIKDLTVGNSIIVNEGKANQVQIDENGIKVGTGSVYITGEDVSIGSGDGAIKLSTLGNVADLNDAVKAETVVGAINKENARAEAAEKVLQDNIDAEAKRAQAAEKVLQDNIDAEAERAQAAEAVLDGKIAAEATARETADAVLQGQIDTNANAITGLNQRLGQLNGRVNKVGAGAAALAALHPLEYDPEDKLTFSAGMGNYAGQNAAALGAFYRPNEKLMFSLGGTMGNGENMVNLGVSIGLDGATGLAKMSKTELIQKVNAMEAEMAELRALVVKLAADKK